MNKRKTDERSKISKRKDEIETFLSEAKVYRRIKMPTYRPASLIYREISEETAKGMYSYK
jgi:hypothetical protein